MEVILLILLIIAMLAILILIFLRFHLDRLVLRIEMQWNAVKLLMRDIITDKMEVGSFSPEEIQRISAFTKSRNQIKQVTAANELGAILAIPTADWADFLQRRNDYNSAVRLFNKKIENSGWKFVSQIFRIKPRVELVEFEIAPNEPDAP